MDHEIVSPRKRSKPNNEPLTCPVCGITLRPQDMNQHYLMEMDKLQKLSTGRSRKSLSQSPPAASIGCTSSSSAFRNVNGEGSSSSSTATTTTNQVEDSWGTYQKIKNNRQNRLKIKPKKRKDEITCPVCNQRTTEDINIHVEKCLRKSDPNSASNNGHISSDDESTIDVDGESYEEYEWAGQTRIRAAGLLPGGYSAAGIGTRITPASDDENELNVDGDDNVYGPPQFSERDVIVPISKDECNSYLRDLVIGNEPPNLRNDAVKEGSHSRAPTEPRSTMEAPEPLPKDDFDSNSDTNHTIESLKSKIREYERYVQNKPKCLICMDDFKLPVVSICCWHVYCQECWLNSLGSKKLCPQCNSITGPADLRRIYL
ncbi:E3 ubiquitin-protein ligase Rnf220 [Culicoides brevitarsis]|uniref:E3 ubiquitin-protein ligase Rnf220 n=1 Tax=Culicoides brevitarsis TaxID=469753 RepID=UPI00307B5709